MPPALIYTVNGIYQYQDIEYHPRSYMASVKTGDGKEVIEKFMRRLHRHQRVGFNESLWLMAEKMLELERSSGETWERVKETADKIWEDLKADVADAHSKFK